MKRQPQSQGQLLGNSPLDRR